MEKRGGEGQRKGAGTRIKVASRYKNPLRVVRYGALGDEGLLTVKRQGSALIGVVKSVEHSWLY